MRCSLFVIPFSPATYASKPMMGFTPAFFASW